MDVDLPVNRGRTSTFPWSKNRTLKERREKLFGQIADRLQVALVERKELHVKLVVAEASEEALRGWISDAEDALGKVAPGCNFKIEPVPTVSCASFLAQQVDIIGTAPQLIIAAQLWPDGATKHTSSEGAAAVLIETSEEPAARIFRPMTSMAVTLDADLKQMADVQILPNRISHGWFTRCEPESGVITSAFTVDNKARPVERPFEHIVGEPGPVTSWIALATALEASKGGEPNLVAWREPDDDSLHLCMVGGAQPQDSQKEL
ncbi:hypothetical protein [Burkholderia cepacia]|uniref:hypothetical protein n=1 Tax=Burkholderia cepacia TaxID=292 RepID=UPI001E53A09A|nr:hypothetical protein [Burkholderia cepacia]